MTIADVYRALWRHHIFITVLTAIVVGSVWFATTQVTKVYRTSVLVRVTQPINDPTQAFGILAAGQQLAQTYAQIVVTRTTAQAIYDNLGHSVPLAAIEGKVHGTPVTDLALLSISADSTDPAVAERIANAAPAALSDFIARSGSAREQITVVEQANRPTTPFKPNLKLNLILALLAGLLLNSALALLIELLSDRLPEPEEFEIATGYPILATIPPVQFQPVGLGLTSVASLQPPSRSSRRQASHGG